MSTRHKLAELLTFGYAKENYTDKCSIPDAINQVIQSFYDEYFYWRIQGNQMKEFVNANNGDILHCPTTFSIKGIEFEFTLCPDGWKEDHSGFTEIYIEVKHKPSNIEYFRLSVILSCETSQMTLKFMKRWWMKGNGKGFTVFKKSEYENREFIDFNCKIHNNKLIF